MTQEPALQHETSISDEALEAVRRDRFRQRVERVLEAMRRERIDWRALAFITPDGRIALRVVPIEMSPQEQ